MMVVFFFNYLNHHQVLVADEMHRLLGDNFHFVATLPRNEKELKGGADYSSRPYCILAGEKKKFHDKAIFYSRVAEVCVFGACSEEYALERAIKNSNGLSFEVGERWLKHGLLSLGSKVLRRWLSNYHKYYKDANFYKLCCSAFAAQDDERMFAYKNRHYKWGYFTNVDENFSVEAPCPGVSTSGTLHTLMWCARFLKWKHPELPVRLAARLKAKGYKFVIDMYGSGEELDPTKVLAKQLGVDDVMCFKGNKPNDEILEAMRHHEIFLFTSDKNEGWGAVANESMANGCALVASDAIGSTPYLVKDGYNGFKFKSCNIDSLVEKVEWLFAHHNECQQMRHNACSMMKNVWSPRVAAANLLKLVDNLQHGRDTTIMNGPCSKA